MRSRFGASGGCAATQVKLAEAMARLISNGSLSLDPSQLLTTEGQVVMAYGKEGVQVKVEEDSNEQHVLSETSSRTAEKLEPTKPLFTDWALI